MNDWGVWHNGRGFWVIDPSCEEDDAVQCAERLALVNPHDEYIVRCATHTPARREWSQDDHDAPTLPPPGIPAASVTLEWLARRLFDTDPSVEALVCHVGEGDAGRIHRASNRAWDRDECGWRSDCMARAAAILSVRS